MDTEALDTPVEAPADVAAPEPTLDELLAEYDREVSRPEPAADQVGQETTDPVQNDELDKLLADLSGPTPDQKRIGELEGEIGALRQAEWQRQEGEAFEKLASDLQARLPEHLPPDYSRSQLLAMAAERPELVAAFRYRNASIEERRAADAEFQRLEALYAQVQNSPSNDPRRAVAIQQIERRGYELSLIIGGPAMIRQAERDVEKRAREFRPIDTEQTQLHMEVAAAVRGQSQGTPPPDPPIAWGKLGKEDFRRTVMNKFGYDPGLI